MMFVNEDNNGGIEFTPDGLRFYKDGELIMIYEEHRFWHKPMPIGTWQDFEKWVLVPAESEEKDG